MHYIPRQVEKEVRYALARDKSVLLLGPRQTGKTTLLGQLKHHLSLSFVQAAIRQRYEKSPESLQGEIESLAARSPHKRPIVLLDEIQKVPSLLDVIQDLIDRKQAVFVLSGSSARKLKRGPGVNLLPGRVVTLHLDPLNLWERPNAPIKDRLFYGDLPGIVHLPKMQDQETDLKSYVVSYLEEEVRAEGIVRNFPSFARFLELAASESGRIVNFRKLSQEIGVAHTTISSYYEILEDCFIAERVEPYTRSTTRRKLTRAERYLFFDMGVRRAAAGEGTLVARDRYGPLFEHWVGLELKRLTRNHQRTISLRFWRDPDGPEVDWVLETERELIPIEVKWTGTPRAQDAVHLETFIREYSGKTKKGFIICQTPRPVRISATIEAIPWQQLTDVLKEI